jgi:hypothetical protein
MSFFLQLARKRTRSGPCSPLASACLEHSIDSGLWTTGAGFAFGAGFAAAGGPAAGGVAGGGVCPTAALAHALMTSAIINFFISAPSEQSSRTRTILPPQLSQPEYPDSTRGSFAPTSTDATTTSIDNRPNNHATTTGQQTLRVCEASLSVRHN